MTALSNGLHSLTVYANDTYENMALSETVYFTVAKPSDLASNLSIEFGYKVIVFGVVSIVLAIAAAVYLTRKCKRKAAK